MRPGRLPEAIVGIVCRRGWRSGGFGRGGLVLWVAIVVGLVGCVGVIVEFPFIILSDAKGVTAQGGILRFAQNDRWLLRMTDRALLRMTGSGGAIMFPTLTRSMTTFLATAVLLVFGVLAGCQASGATGQGESDPPPAQEANRTLYIGEGVSVASLFREPRNVQDLVNRSHAIVIGTISAISDLTRELPYGTTSEDFQGEMYQGYEFSTEVTYYDIAIEEVLLDDGNVRAYPRLRLDGAHNPAYPQIGERFLFALGRNPDSLSYGIAANWDVLPLDGGDIRNFDGTSPGYVGVTDEASLVKAIREAVPYYDFLPVNQWPSRFAAIEGDGDGEEPAAPGGSGGDDVGPTGDTGGGSSN